MRYGIRERVMTHYRYAQIYTHTRRELEKLGAERPSGLKG